MSSSIKPPAVPPLDAAAVRAQCEAVLTESLYWFPVRHHSPAAAWHLEAAILARRPRVIFIEGPHEANDLVSHVVDSRTKPPVAIYSSFRDDANVLGLAGIASPAVDIPARFASWYPLLAYSPEYVAMLAAKKIGAQVVLIDLPHYALIRPAPLRVAPDASPAALETPDKRPAGQRVEIESDRLIVESDFYRTLAKAAGYRSWNEAWDSLFESRRFSDHEHFRRELATFCAAARATASHERIAADGTLERERFMLHTIRQTLADRGLESEQAVVVCGGFHLFLDRDDSAPLTALPPGTVYTTVVPYSFFRVSELSGYAAGNRAPQFYQRHWDLLRDGRPQDIVVEHVVNVLKEARREGEPLSAADAIATGQHASMLARLRGRDIPVLDDIHDALITCCCKGDPADEGTYLRRAIDAVDIGGKIGRVTPALGQLPVVYDFYAQLDSLDLGAVLGKEKKIALVLDKRNAHAARQSVFLHRLRFLGVPLADMREAPSGDFATGQIFREKWALRWSPQVEPALIERNLYGDSVETAALARLQEELARDEGDAGRTCRQLVHSIDMDLPHLVHQVEQACGRAIDGDERFISLSDALSSLTLIERYAIYRNLRRDALEDLIARCFDRACFSLPGVASVPEDQQAAVVAALLSVAELVQRGDRPGVDRDLFVEHVRQAADESVAPFLRGVFRGTLVELRAAEPDSLAAELTALAQSPLEQMVTAGDFLDGVMAVSRTSILLGADALIEAIDQLLRAADWEPFLIMVPRLRAAFERLHPGQRDGLAARRAPVRLGRL